MLKTKELFMIIRLDWKFYDTEKWKLIYSNGRHSDRGVDIYQTTLKTLVAVPWSKWQGEDPAPYLITTQDLKALPHADRVAEALEKMGIDYLEKEDI